MVNLTRIYTRTGDAGDGRGHSRDRTGEFADLTRQVLGLGDRVDGRVPHRPHHVGRQSEGRLLGLQEQFEGIHRDLRHVEQRRRPS